MLPSLNWLSCRAAGLERQCSPTVLVFSVVMGICIVDFPKNGQAWPAARASGHLRPRKG